MGPADRFWTGLPLGRGVRLLAWDPNGLAALEKPEGILSHPNEPRDEARSLLTCPYDPEGEAFAWEGGAAGRLWLLNRLDAATSGLVLVAADRRVADEVRGLFERRGVAKTYHALVFGAPRAPAERWRDLLAVEKRSGQIRTRARGNVPAECAMRRLQAFPGPPALALLELKPATGRSHQLRVQCARRGLPIVGDQTYGDFRANREFAKKRGWKRLFLHASSVAVSYRLQGRTHRFAAEAPLPECFRRPTEKIASK